MKMKSVIYYFSGTGNSYRAAEKICKNIPDCELIPIVKSIKNGGYSHSAPRIGFVFPLYFLSFPKIVMDFIEKYDFSGKDYIFIAVTRGTNFTGGVIAHMREILRKKGTALSAGFYINMPSNDITFIFPVPDSAKQNELLASADWDIQEISNKIIAGEKYYEREFAGFLRHIRHSQVYLIGLANGWKKFYSDGNCNGCGICEKVCPVSNISMIDKKPAWGALCQLCEGCLNFCPKEAIQYGKKTAGRMRYHNPVCGWKDIEMQKME